MSQLSLFNAGSTSLLGPPPMPAAPTPLPGMRPFGDVKATRQLIFDNALKAAQEVQPVENQRHALRLTNVKYVDPEHHRVRDQKNAILTGGTLGRRMRGTWELIDKATGGVLDSRDQIVASVPYLTHRGTFIHGGNEYTLNHQQRLLPGVFARQKENQEIEAHANVLPGKGVSHRYQFDPSKNVFYLNLQQAHMPLLPLLQAMGVHDRELREAWGDAIFADNYHRADHGTLRKLADKILPKAQREEPDEAVRRKALVDAFAAMELDPNVTKRTLGYGHKGLDKAAILEITKKLLAVSRGEAKTDDRDHLSYQTVLGPEDLFAERLRRDHSKTRRQLLFKMSNKGHLRDMPSGALTPQLEQALLGSGLGAAIEEINPAELLDKQTRITRMGEGGIPSYDAIPDEARAVQPSHYGFIDPVRTPESFSAGVDVHLSRGTRKGADGRLYSLFKNVRTGKVEWKSPHDLADAKVGFPGPAWWTRRQPVLNAGEFDFVEPNEIDYVPVHFEDSFSPLGNLVPMKSALKPQRMAMASRMTTQALPLKEPEAPLVRSAVPEEPGKSFEEHYAKHMGALHAEKSGRVLAVDGDSIKVRYNDGTQDELDIHNTFPFNRKTFLHQTPTVEPGQTFTAGQLLAKSNYTDGKGHTALGANFYTGYLPWKGYNFKDAIVMSESAAKRSSSEHMYQHDLELDDKTRVGTKAFASVFPAKHDRETLAKFNDDGTIKPGTIVKYGDPLLLALRERDTAANKIHKKRQPGFVDRSLTWDHHDEGVVTDVAHGKNGPVVVVKSVRSLQVGDKMSGRYGDKGVVAAVIPDDRMPHDKEGRPLEVLLSPQGITSRTNPAQKHELWLSKIAAKRGEPYVLDDHQGKDWQAFVDGELKKHSVAPREHLIDPETGNYIKDVATGHRFLMKLVHTAEDKGQARSGGGYTSEEAPSKGGASGSKRVSLLDVNALVAHGATEVLRDVGSFRGQANPELWLQFMEGHNPKDPRVPMAYEKYLHQLQASGTHLVREGTQLHIKAMKDSDVDQLAGDREITRGDTVRFDHELRPIPGGLFDPQLTGGHGGRRWSFIRLPEPLPNPVMEEPIRQVLGLTQKQFEAVLEGKEKVAGSTKDGAAGIAEALERINMSQAMDQARGEIAAGRASKRDKAIKRLRFLKRAEAVGLHPRDWLLSKAPVLPPAFRPVSLMQGSGTPLVSDPNYLYKELLEAADNQRAMGKELGERHTGAERLATYHALKAVVGLGDPITKKSQDRKVTGILQSIFGNSPKFGTVQRKLISSTVDVVGRAVITPNPAMDMDSVGIPENKAFDIYERFIVRNLRRRGMSLLAARREVENKTPLARSMIEKEMRERPVFINRAPVLHKFGILAFRPQLVPGNVMQVSPVVVKGFNADFDGDAMQFHVPVGQKAVKEAYERMLPSKALISPADFKSPVHVFEEDYLAGLYHATAGRSERRARTFRNKEDMLRAYARHEIAADDPVEILEH